jgi:uncharacterized repeat protein (TIGR01451 family)
MSTILASTSDWRPGPIRVDGTRELIPGWWFWASTAAVILLLCGCQTTDSGREISLLPDQQTQQQLVAHRRQETQVNTPALPHIGPETLGANPIAHQPAPPSGVQPVSHIAQAPAPVAAGEAAPTGIMPVGYELTSAAGHGRPMFRDRHSGTTCQMVGGGCMNCPPGASLMGPPPPGGPLIAQDEYVCDGGDRWPRTTYGADGQFRGLNPEDAVAGFETENGDRRVECANRVCIYAPRFAAVRTVTDLITDAQMTHVGDTTDRLPILGIEDHTPVLMSAADTQLGRVLNADVLRGVRDNVYAGIVSTQIATFDATNDLLPHENLSIIRYGVLEEADKPLVAEAVLRAEVWTGEQAVQVEIGGQTAQDVTVDQKAQEIYEIHAVGPSKLKICKIASHEDAAIGDIVTFTLRFDNVGARPLQNVVITDNLVPRLEYVADSTRSSVKSDYQRDANGEIVRNEAGHPQWDQNPVSFSVSDNDVGSQTLRWELGQPLMPGQGGIIRFEAKVR